MSAFRSRENSSIRASRALPFGLFCRCSAKACKPLGVQLHAWTVTRLDNWREWSAGTICGSAFIGFSHIDPVLAAHPLLENTHPGSLQWQRVEMRRCWSCVSINTSISSVKPAQADILPREPIAVPFRLGMELLNMQMGAR
jgi:hypothetical protein